MGPQKSIKHSTKKDTKAPKANVNGKTNLGKLILKYRDVDETLYSFTSNVDYVHEDMDLSVEEFSDIVGADIDELLDALNKVVK